jgi:TrmH family RNA methyltransferase
MKHPHDMIELSSAANPRVKAAARLRTREERVERGVFGVEGAREIRQALSGGFAPEEVFVCSDALSPEGEEIYEMIRRAVERVTIYRVPLAVFEKLVVREASCGLFVVFRSRLATLDDIDVSHAPLLLVSEDVEKPGNLGALTRSLDGAGARAMIILDPRERVPDPFNPNAVRASLGALFRHPVVTCSPQAFFEWCRRHEILILAASPHAREVYTDVDMRGATAILLGSEAWGLSSYWTEARARLVTIPMKGHVDSLNVSVSGAVMLYEARRQRDQGN